MRRVPASPKAAVGGWLFHVRRLSSSHWRKPWRHLPPKGGRYLKAGQAMRAERALPVPAEFADSLDTNTPAQWSSSARRLPRF
jgi:hypothetical protein